MTEAYEGMAKGAGASYSDWGRWRAVNILINTIVTKRVTKSVLPLTLMFV